MAADEPPYLTVGTDVSAKYKGAFCEAKVKKVNRVVKCKVTFKNSLGSSMIPDDQIRGSLRLGAEVEAFHPERKQYLDAVINKMQDYSQYTVVFDDGDETTLRRTSLCLKSGRHFAESPTLDQFPLTNPEHFGTPVIGTTKTKRKRRSTMNSAALDYYSSDEEILPKKKFSRVKEKESEIGKIVCIDYGDRRKKDSWYPGLIVSNNAQIALRINPKEEHLIRSFKDGKYYTVSKRDTREFSREMGRKVENNALRSAVEKAMLYYQKGELPLHWDRARFGVDILSNEEDSHDTDSDSSDNEPSEEKDRFVAQLYKFMDERGTPINKAPSVGCHDINLYKLFKVVHKMGGYNRVTNQNKWKIIYSKMGFPLTNPSGSNQIKLAYKRYLHSFEDFYRKLGCTMVSNSRSTRGRHRSDRNFIITRNRDRDNSSPKRKKEKDRSVEKKPEDKVKTVLEKKEFKVKSGVEKKEFKLKTDVNPKSEEKPKLIDKKRVDKLKSEEKEPVVKLKKEDNKPRLVRSVSLNKDKKERDGPDEKKETRNDRAKAREDAKKDKGEGTEKKKETRSSTKSDQDREKREKESVDKKVAECGSGAKEHFKKEDRVIKYIKEEKLSLDKKEDTPPFRNKKNAKEKEEKAKSSFTPSSTKDKKDFKKDKTDDVAAPKEKEHLIPKEKMLSVVKLEKKDDIFFGTDRKEQNEVKTSRLGIEREERVSKSLREDKEKLVVEPAINTENPCKEKAPKDVTDVKEDNFVRILGEIKQEINTEREMDKDIFVHESLPGRSGFEDDGYMPGKIMKKRRSTTDEKDVVKSVMDIYVASDDDLQGPLCEKSEENKDGKPKNIEVGDKVKVKYGRGRTQKVYEAKVLKIEIDVGEKRYYVHYAGWNTRYDEWVRRNFIVENISEHNRSVRRKKQHSDLKGTSPPSLSKKNDRSRPPSISPAPKLHRKNSSSSTNSSTVSNSRATRSDKSCLHTSPFSIGLQPRRRTRKKSGISLTLTDTSQDSESDGEDSILLDDDEDDDEDIDVEGIHLGKPKEEIFSDDEEIEFETFRKLPEKEHQKDDEEEPVTATAKEEEICEILDIKKPDMKSVSNFEPENSVLDSVTGLQSDKEEEVKVEHKNANDIPNHSPSTNEDNPFFLKNSLTQKLDHVDVPVLKKEDEVVMENPRSISELIEKKYIELVEKQSEAEAVETVAEENVVGDIGKSVDDKMPPLMTYMGSCDEIASGTHVKATVGVCNPTVSQNNPISCLPQTKDDKEIKDVPKNILNISSHTDIKPQTALTPTNMEVKKESVLITTASKRSYFPMFHFNNPKYADSANVMSDKNLPGRPNIQPLLKNLSDDRKDQITTIGGPMESKKVSGLYGPFQNKVSYKDRLMEEKNTFPLIKLTNISHEPSSNVVAGSMKPTNEKTNYDSVIHNISNLFKRDLEEKSSNFKVRKPLLQKEEKVEQKPFEFSLATLSKPKLIENASKPLPISPFFNPFSKVKTIYQHSTLKSTPSLENLVDTKSNGGKPTKTNPPISNVPLVKKDSSSSFDSLKITNMSQKDETVAVLPVKPLDVKETSTTHTSVIAFASSAVSTVASPLPSVEKKVVDEKKRDFPFLVNSPSSTKDAMFDAVTEYVQAEIEKIEKSVGKSVENSTSKQENADVREKNNPIELRGKDMDFGESIHKSLVELSIAEKERESFEAREQSVSANSNSSPGSVCNVFLNVSADKSTKDTKELFSPPKNSEEIVKGNSEKDIPKPITYLPSVSVLPDNTIPNAAHATPDDKPDSVPNIFENVGSRHTPPKKEVKKRKSKGSKKLITFDALDKDEKPKEGKLKSKKKAKFDLDDLTRSKDGEMKTKMKKLKKNKNKKRFSKAEERSSELSAKTDTSGESGLKDMFLEKIKKKEKRRREEKKFSRMELKFDELADSKGEFSKKDRKKGKKNKDKMSHDRKADLSDKKIKKKKKVHIEENLESDSDKETHSRLTDKKKKKEKKKSKPKDNSSSDEAAENRLLIDEEQSSFAPVLEIAEKKEKADDPDMSFLLCEEKVPASPVGVNSLPEDTTGSSSLEDNSNNRSPSSDEERIQAVSLDEGIVRYPRSANMDVLDTMNKHSAEACAVLDNTPPTTPSSSPVSMPSSSPSHDREPFLHYTESTQSGRESYEGDLESFHCGLNRSITTESEEYRAATTLAFAVCKSVGEKPMTEICQAPALKRQKGDLDDFATSKRRKKNKCAFGAAEVSKIGNTRYKAAASRSPRGESCDTYDSSNASILTAGSPSHGSATSTHFASFSHHASPQMSTTSDGSVMSSPKTSKMNFYVPLDEYKDPEKRISVLQDKMSEMKKLYASLKAEVAMIDRRRKKARKKIRESATSTPANNTSTPGEDVQNSS